jgi:beta-lactam-binding protein with PASTA domain
LRKKIRISWRSDVRKAPDVLGLSLEKAEEILKDAGIAWRIVRTAPPPGRRKYESTQTRVVRQSPEGDTEILLVCDV